MCTAAEYIEAAIKAYELTEKYIGDRSEFFFSQESFESQETKREEEKIKVQEETVRRSAVN